MNSRDDPSDRTVHKRYLTARNESCRRGEAPPDFVGGNLRAKTTLHGESYTYHAFGYLRRRIWVLTLICLCLPPCRRRGRGWRVHHGARHGQVIRSTAGFRDCQPAVRARPFPLFRLHSTPVEHDVTVCSFGAIANFVSTLMFIALSFKSTHHRIFNLTGTFVAD